jgi:hypothetical protein
VKISIQGDKFLFDDRLTYSDFPTAKPEALGRLMNSRMVQATFDDENPETIKLFNYPDGSPFNPDRQTDEFVAALPSYRRHGVIAATVNFQGGFPQYHIHLRRDQILQDWENNAFTAEGALKDRYADRMRRVIEGMDEQRMACIVGLFYFGQNHKLRDEAAVRRAVNEAMDFFCAVGRDNVMVEVNNEANIGYVHEVLRPQRIHELILAARERSGGRFLVSTSYGGGGLPNDAVMHAADFLLVHGNGQRPHQIRAMVEHLRARTEKPIVFNEDSTRVDNLRAAWEAGASWGYYDQGGLRVYHDGFQSPPTNWAINTFEKITFFTTVAELCGIEDAPSYRGDRL